MEALSSARSGYPMCVLVEGEAGSGKTSLLSAFTASLPDLRCVTAAGDEAERALPFGVLDELGRQLRLLHQAEAPPTTDHADPFAAGAAVLQHLGALSRRAPLAVLVDDVHLVDPPSIAALTFAMRRLHADAILVLLAARAERTGSLPPGLMRLIDDRGARLVLEGLSVAAVRDLGRAMGVGPLSQRAASRLRDHTAGNPLHLRALLSELTLDQAEAIDVPLPVPRSLARLVLGRVGATSPRAQQLAAAAAVLGAGPTLHDAADVAGLSDARDAVDELTRAGILHPEEAPGRTHLRFTHPLLRSAVYDGIGLVARAELHARAAGVCSGPDALRHRVSAAQAPDPDLVAALNAQARRDLSAGRLRDAATALLAACPIAGQGAERDRLTLDAVDLLLREGDLATALLHAPALDRMGISAGRLQVQARLAWLSGRVDDAESLGRQAWDRVGELEPAARDRLAAMLAQIAIQRDEGPAAAEWAQRALASGVLPDDMACATRATGALGLGLSGRAAAGLALLAAASADDTTVPLEQQLLAMRGTLRMIVDDLDGARADLAACAPSASRGVRPHQLTALGAWAELEYRAGDWDSATSLAQQLIGLVDDTEQIWLAAWAHALAALVPAGRGAWDLADTHVAESRRAAAVLADSASRVYADWATIHLAYCRGDPEGAVRAAKVLVAKAAGPAGEPGVLGWLPEYLTALVDLRRLGEAEPALREMERRARDRGHRSRRASLARVRGELEAARGRAPAARAAFREAVDLGVRPGDALEISVAHAAYGRFLRRLGERRGAVEQLEVALEMFTGLGANPFLQRCEAELAACGRARSGGQGGAQHAELTPQELAVARLVAAGRRNQEIADELVLSVKTIEFHLGHVYAKLRVRSRTELAARWSVPSPRPSR